MVKPVEGVPHFTIDYDYIKVAACQLGHLIKRYYGAGARLYGIPRGGVCAMYAVMAYTPENFFSVVGNPEDAQILIDDLVDTGATRKKFALSHPNRIFAVLFDKTPTERNHLVGISLNPATGWLDFPWEANDVV